MYIFLAKGINPDQTLNYQAHICFLRHFGCKSQLQGCGDGVVNESSDVGLKYVISCKKNSYVMEQSYIQSIFEHVFSSTSTFGERPRMYFS